MKEKKPIFVMQRDARMQAAARWLAGQGWPIQAECAAADCGVWVLPMLLTGQEPGLAELLYRARPGTLVLCGHPDPAVARLPRQLGVELADYAARPELAAWNAVPTAEGCLVLLMVHTGRTLWRQKILVTGFGRVAQALASRLVALGAEVTVAARSPGQRAQAECMGCRAISLAELRCPVSCPVVVNTIPAQVLGRAELAQLPPGALVVELASRPGGLDGAAARACGLTVLSAPGLPGKCAPETAGEGIARTVAEILQERGKGYGA